MWVPVVVILSACTQEVGNQPPTMEQTDFSLVAGEVLNIVLSDTDPEGDTVRWDVQAGPSNGDVISTETGIRYAPNPGFTGVDSLSIVLRDDSESTSPISLNLSIQLPDWLVTIPECGFPVFDAFTLASISPPPKGGENYLPPDETDRLAVVTSLEAWFAQDAGQAMTEAATAGYDLCRNAQWGLWSPASVGEGKALWAVNWDRRAQGLIVETPHPENDLDTLAQGVALTQRLGARALITSGTHRCANTLASQCSGQTSVCTGSLAPYPESDMAHTLVSRFQAAHEALTELFPTDLVVSLHGFGDNGVSLSNGTSDAIDPSDPVARLASALKDRLPDEAITTCNTYDGDNYLLRLCGTTNVQGRHLNGSVDACTQPADQASQRFIHMEQSLTIRQSELDAVLEAFETLRKER
jgi:hypothetical protein